MLIVANWKAYVEDMQRAKKLFAVSKKLARTTKSEIVLAPPAPLLGALAARNTSRVSFAAQDISATTGGALTGEITAPAYFAGGATYVILGHSERRALGDTDAIITEKLTRAFAHGLTPILCVGERERDTDGRYLAFIREELTNALSGLTQKERAHIIIAYEPIWAIGKTASSAIRPNDLAEMTLYIRKILAELLPSRSASRAVILYGGSVEPDDVLELATNTSVDGFLIGHASTEAHSFGEIITRLAARP